MKHLKQVRNECSTQLLDYTNTTTLLLILYTNHLQQLIKNFLQKYSLLAPRLPLQYNGISEGYQLICTIFISTSAESEVNTLAICCHRMQASRVGTKNRPGMAGIVHEPYIHSWHTGHVPVCVTQHNPACMPVCVCECVCARHG